ncbi:MAG: hypothetical protein FDW93_04340 [Bergeyella sp.]|nr:hypothetical protein [Bergeyella sp.]
MKLIRFVVLLVHFVVVIALFTTMLNEYIAPSQIDCLNFLSLGFPYLFILHVLFIILWVLMWKKRAFFFIFLTVFIFKPISRWFAWNNQGEGKIKVITLNGHNGNEGIQKIKKFLRSKSPDIVLMQEFDDANKLYGNKVQNKHLAIITPHEIIRKRNIIDEKALGGSFFADVNINGRIIRIVNIYLEPFHLEKNMIKPESDLEVNQKKIDNLLHKMPPVFRDHEIQLRFIKKYITHSPYPVIVGGDLNAVPNSWEYYFLENMVHDAFVQAGRGSGTTFHDFKIPMRIDYLFNSKSIIAKKYRVYREKKLSDHFPVIAEFDIL